MENQQNFVPPPEDISSTASSSTNSIPPSGMKPPPKNIFSIVIIILLALNLCFSVYQVVRGGSARSVSVQLQESKMMENYSRSLGKKNISISNDKVSTSSYGSKTLTATATNHSNKTFDHVSIQFIFYKGNSVVGTASDYLYYLGPNQSAKIDASMYDIDSYDRYELDYISASE